MNKYDKALSLFTERNLSPKEYTYSPFSQGEYIYATDRMVAIRIPSGKTEEAYENRERPVAGIPFNKERNADELFTFKELKELYDSVPEVYFKRCEACWGDGRVDFEFEFDGSIYTSRGDCPVCFGTGSIRTEDERKDFRCGVKFMEDSFPINNRYLGILLSAMSVLGIDSVRLVRQDFYTCAFLLGEGVEVTIMGYHPAAGNEDNCVCYKKKEKE